MPRPRKTLQLRDLVAWVNERNRISTCEPSVREGWNALANSFLMAADAYGGFQYLTADELGGDAKGQPPGIIRDAHGHRQHAFPDKTRIRFLIPEGL
jgi:hypothetical protein